MKASEFLERIKESDITMTDIIERIFKGKDNKGGFVSKEDFPEAFDKKGNVRLDFKFKKVYNTFCPFHLEQRNGDSFAIYNEDKSVYCYGNCNFNKRPMNAVEFVMATVFKLDHSMVYEIELSKEYFWPAAEFLVKEFGSELGLTLNDIKQKKGKVDAVSKILEETVSYYHFLGSKNKFYNQKLTSFLTEKRYLDNGIVPLQELIEKFKLGITPFIKKDETNDKLYQYLLKKGFKKDDILKSRVCNEYNGTVVDFFRNRAIIPYIHKGKVIGIYGRDMNPYGEKKNRHLRLEGEVRIPNGLDGILDKEEFNLVEGEFSKIAVVAMGDESVMEARGINGFKEEHAELIGKVRKNNPDKCKRCYILFDPDDSGADSVEKIGRRLINVGVEVLVVRLPILYEKNETIFVDPNDLLKVYGKEATTEFKKLKEEAISYDAFMLLHKLKKAKPSTLSEARTTFSNLSEYLHAIPKLERIFIIEEVLEHLETAIDKNLLRDYLKEVWLHEKVIQPIEGFDVVLGSKSKFFVATKDEEFYEQYKNVSKSPIVLVRDSKVFSTKSKTLNKKILLDDSFSKEEKDSLSLNNVGRGKIEVRKNGKINIIKLLP